MIESTRDDKFDNTNLGSIISNRASHFGGFTKMENNSTKSKVEVTEHVQITTDYQLKYC